MPTLGIAVFDPAAAKPNNGTVLLACEALAAGWSVLLLTPWDLRVDPDGSPRARGRRFSGACSPFALAEAWAHGGGEAHDQHAADLDLLLLRASPLPDALLLWARLAEDRGLVVRNAPGALASTGHKGWLAAQAGVPRPATLLTCSVEEAVAFAAARPEGVVLKPGRGFGGRGVARVAPGDVAGLVAAFEVATAGWDRTVIVQSFVAGELEKRLLWLEGRLVGAYARRRAPGDFRHNLKVGGSPEASAITAEDQALALALSPGLLRAGVWLAGIDVLGGVVTEVNTTNPGGLFWSAALGFPQVTAEVFRSLQG